MGHFCWLTIILVSLLSALAVPVKKSGQSVNPLTPVVDPTDSNDIVYLNQNGQWITRDGEVIDTRTNPIVPIDQPPNSIQPGVTINQFGQFVTPSGQIVTLIENDQYLTQDGQVLGQNGNPIV
ncbi:hypothetical protein PCASD_17283 [Puccinia coronata f. sp. avenae]|uniref:Cuticle protein n=1 Tax=Puccinia coronata f. sp. avenae TaxID=200324 RepID=A0A2N5T7I1_9BASI|nr:hypothetical protein PCASD_17283 [Puccinia coronata f. sp. avenae]